MPSPATAAASSQAQYASQFLSTSLSQRGPNALPYAEDTKWLIRHHLVSLVEAFPSLIPKASLFTHNDGRAAHLLQAEGTVPIVFAGAVYNIPAVVWLLETYPRSPPSVFLTPTRDMIVKPGHPFVDRSGHVMVPYLRSWVYPSSNLVDLVRSMSQLFGQDPPLYTRQPGSSPSPNPNPSPAPTPDPTPPPNSHSLSSSYSRPSPSQSYSSSSSTYPASPYAIRPSPQHHHQGHRPMDDPAEVFRRNAINAILEKVHSDKAALQSRLDGELEGLFATQAELRRRDETLSLGLRQMVDEKEALEQQLQLILMNTDILEGWVRENEGKMKARWNEGAGGPEDAFEPRDSLSKQLLDCTATDLAEEDTIYALDKAAQEGIIPFAAYLKHVRALARDQFFQRATALKVRAAQVQAHVTTMAARNPQYAV